MALLSSKHRLLPAVWAASGLAIGLLVGACGLGRGPDQGGESPGVRCAGCAATVNGRPIYTEDVRSYAVQAGYLQEGQDLAANSDTFYLALEELIQTRLFAMDAEQRGLDREPDVRRRIDNARERVLAAAVYDEIDQRANDPATIERTYRENAARLGQGEVVHLRHIQFDSREAAEAAKRRLDHGEHFEPLAFELSTDRASAADGGDWGAGAVTDLNPQLKELVSHMNAGQTAGPLQIGNTWHLVRLEERRQNAPPSLEELRPQIVRWLRYQEISKLQQRLEANARIERIRAAQEPAQTVAPSGDVTEPAGSPDTSTAAPPSRPPGAGDHAPPAFAFPMGPSAGGPEPSGGGSAAAPSAAPPTATVSP